MAFMWVDIYTVISALTIFYTTYGLYLAVWRLHFSPLSHIPGPKLAIATSWVEFYYDVWKRGLYYQKVKEFHTKYGPIIRISPHEVHVDDPDYYDELYNNNYKWEKYEPYMAQFNSPGAAISTAQYDLHRMRRKPENNFFSKRSIVALEPRIHDYIAKLSKRLDEFCETKSPLTINYAMLCFTTDVVSEYVFGQPWDLLDTTDLSPWMLQSTKRAGELSHTIKQWPWIIHIINTLPLSWVSKLDPGTAKILRFQDIGRQNIIRIRNETPTEKVSNSNIIRTLLDSDLPSPEKSTARLTKEAFTLVSAGADTTGSTISMLIYHLAVNPTKLARLRGDLKPLFSSPSQMPTWTELEEVPYMAAVVKEGLRLNNGVISRIPRCAPDRDTRYKDVVIPRGTPVGMSNPDVHENANNFPNPKAFLPERWLQDAASDRKESSRLDRWLVPFSRGNRQCLGMNLAYAEVYLCVATLVMCYDFEPYKTTREDVDWYHDFTVPQPKVGSKLIRMIVKHRDSDRKTT